MKNTSELFENGVKELRKVFGDKYLKDNYKNTTFACGMVDDKTYQFFTGFKTTDDLPEKEGNDHGWVSYARFNLDAMTGNVVFRDYATE